MIIKDPCKKGKCLKYPICIQKSAFYRCDILNKAITEYIHIETPPYSQKSISPIQANYISEFMKSIFPNFEWMDYTIDDYTMGTIDASTGEYLISIYSNDKSTPFIETLYFDPLKEK